MGMVYRYTKNDGASLSWVCSKSFPFAQNRPCSQVVIAYQARYCLLLTNAIPRNGREIRVVVAGVVLKRREKLQVECIPQSQLHCGAAIGSRVKVWRYRLAV